MSGTYHIDLDSISLSDYEKELAGAELLPSRRIIGEEIRERFAVLRKHGIGTLGDLLEALKSPAGVKGFSAKTGLPEEYLSILKREIAGCQPKPVNLADFPGIAKPLLRTLEKAGIRNTKQLFPFVITGKDRDDLCEKLGISRAAILELTKLTDVV